MAFIPNMPRYLLLLVVCFLFLLFCPCGPGHCKEMDGKKINSITLFKPEKPFEQNDAILDPYTSPSIVATDGVIISIATFVNYSEFDDMVDIVTKWTRIEEKNWAKNVVDEKENKWTENTILEKRKQNDIVESKSFVAVAKDKNIYLLVADKKRKKVDFYQHDNEESSLVQTLDWEFELIVGEVSGAKEKKKVAWQAPKTESVSALTKQFKEKNLEMGGEYYGNYGFLTEDGDVVFVVIAEKTEKTEKKKKSFTAVVHLQNAKSDGQAQWNLSYVATAEDCYDDNSIFPWEGKLIMIVHCNDTTNTHKVRESNDMGVTWKDSDGPFALLYDDLKEKENFITTKINNKSVLLFAKEKVVVEFDHTGHEISLWVTDGSRVQDVGIVYNGDYTMKSSLFYTGGELFFLYEHSEKDKNYHDVILTHLKDEMNKINSLLSSWNDMYMSVSQLCNNDTASGFGCVTPMPTVGLVGLLSGGDGNSLPSDKHFKIEQEVKGGTKIKNGFKFSGPGAGAKWSVSKPAGEDGRRTGFAESGMTFVASVNIEFLSQDDDSSLMGVGMGDLSSVGLRCTKDGKWALSGENRRTTILSNEKCEVNKTYQVALTLQGGEVAAYVDWQPLRGINKDSMRIARPETISHVYVGADKNQSTVDSNLTVTNVLLYNRPLKNTEITALKKNKPINFGKKGGTISARDFIARKRPNSAHFSGVTPPLLLLPLFLLLGLCEMVIYFN